MYLICNWLSESFICDHEIHLFVNSIVWINTNVDINVFPTIFIPTGSKLDHPKPVNCSGLSRSLEKRGEHPDVHGKKTPNKPSSAVIPTLAAASAVNLGHRRTATKAPSFPCVFHLVAPKSSGYGYT